MKKILFTAMVLAAFLFAAHGAQAAPVTGEIKVVPSGHGMLLANGIECGGGKTDCTETVTWDNAGPAPELAIHTQSTKTGWGITSWGTCDRLVTMSDCRVKFPASGTRTVYAAFNDIQAPSVFIAGYPSLVGDVLNLNVEASDNELLTKVEYLVDDEVIATRTNDYFNSAIDSSQVPEGTHSVKVRAWHGNGNSTDSLAYDVVFDHTKPEVVLDSPVAYTNHGKPSFSFDAPSEDEYWASCAFRRPGETVELETCGYGEPYSAVVPTEGDWQFVLEVEDAANNTTRVIHDFVVDRTAPVIEFTGGPADATEVEPGTVAYSWTATDPLAIVQACAWDGGEEAACDGAADKELSPGEHRLTVAASDLAGNVATATRKVTVAKRTTTDPGPDTSDRTAPVIGLAAPKQTVRTVRKALRVNVRCDEACSGRVVVRGGRGIRFAGRVYLPKAGLAKLRLRPTAKVRSRLAAPRLRSKRSRVLNLTAVARLSDSAGNTGAASLRFKVAS